MWFPLRSSAVGITLKAAPKLERAPQWGLGGGPGVSGHSASRPGPMKVKKGRRGPAIPPFKLFMRVALAITDVREERAEPARDLWVNWVECRLGYSQIDKDARAPCATLSMLTYYQTSRSLHFPFGAVCSLSGAQPEIWSVSSRPPAGLTTKDVD